MIGVRDLCALERCWEPGRFTPIPVRELELSRPIPAELGDERSRHVHVVLRVHRHPVGETILEPADLSLDRATLGDRLREWCSAAIVRELACRALLGEDGSDAEGRPSAEAASAKGDGSTVLTIAICTRDRPEGLRATLEALRHQQLPQVDLLVIDNAPADDATARVAAEFPAARRVVEPRPGLNHARNKALAEARGTLLAYTDDDAHPDPEWGSAIVRAFDGAPEATALTGLVLPAALEHPAQLLFESYGGFSRGFTRRWWHAPDRVHPRTRMELKNTGRFGTGANMAFRTARLRALGGFDPALDVGTASLGGGDLEVFFRVVKRGGAVLYDPGAVARHRHRATYEALVQQMEQWGSGMAAYVESARLSFPDERSAFAQFDTYMELAWFQRRLLLSFVRESFPRELIRAELRGRRLGAARYAEARAAVGAFESRERRDGPEPSDTLDTSREFDVDLGQPVVALEGAEHARRVILRANRDGREIATVVIENGGQQVGRIRVAHAIATAAGEQVLGMRAPELLAMLREGAIGGTSVLGATSR